MCYAVSTTPDPLGTYYRYVFNRPLFPDYPRPAIWPDGYYVPTSTGDNVIQKHACVADRTSMLAGRPATEQCVVIDGVNFLNNADVDGRALPPPGAPNIMMAAGGTQLKNVLDDDAIYAWTFHVDWRTPANTKVSGPITIGVAPYRYLCGGQLTTCVPQPGTDRRLDAQGDKLMQRLVYRKIGGHESIVALHSIATKAGGGGVRWYEFRLDKQRNPVVYQQGTYAPDGFYRWMGSIGIDRRGNIGIGYSFGGTPHFAGQRFAARLAGDPARPAHAAGDGADRGRSGADRHDPLGGLRNDGHGSQRRLHVLVHRRLHEEGCGELFEPHRSVPPAWMPRPLRPGRARVSAARAARESSPAAASASTVCRGRHHTRRRARPWPDPAPHP